MLDLIHHQLKLFCSILFLCNLKLDPNPIEITIARRPTTRRPPELSINAEKLANFVFIKKRNNPSTFLIEFKKCFLSTVLGDTKCVKLAKFIRPGEDHKFLTELLLVFTNRRWPTVVLAVTLPNFIGLQIFF